MVAYVIYFDESKKIDRESNFSYYGAISIESDILSQVESNIESILQELHRTGELHFVDYKPSEIVKYFQVFNYFLSCTEIKFNIYRVNNDQYFELGDRLGFSDKELRKYFYVKIPERLFYGLVRNKVDIKSVEIIMDKSSEYETFGVFDQIENQMNAHSLYRGKPYRVSSIKGIDSQSSRMLQVLDVILGIVVFLLERKFYTCSSYRELNKQDFIYRLLTTGDNLFHFVEMVSIYSWNQDSIKSAGSIDFRPAISDFLTISHQRDFVTMEAVYRFFIERETEIKKLSSSDRSFRIKLSKQYLKNPYSADHSLGNNLVELFLGVLPQVEFKDRNKFLHCNREY